MMVGLVHAKQISVNYEKASSTPPLAATDSVGAIPALNWNNVVDLNHAITFVDNTGAATALTVALSAGYMDSWNTNFNANENLFGDKVVMGVDPQTLTLTGVPYASYDVIVYLSSWGSEVVDFSLDGGTTVVATLSNSYNPNNFSDGDEFTEGDTYIRLTGLTGDVVVTMDATSDELHLAGFQIVESVDGDADFDGLPDGWELSWPEVLDLTDLTGLLSGPGPGFGTGDFDGDLDSDLEEYTAGTDPTDAQSFVDTDDDGLSDKWEVSWVGNLTDLDGTLTAGSGPGSGTGDYDGDGFSDLEEFEAAFSSDPTNAASTPIDSDADGLSDAWEDEYFFGIDFTTGDEDYDGDYDTNAEEEMAGTDPTDADSFVDSDSDGLGDGWELAFAGNLTDLTGLLPAGSGPGSGTGDFDGDGYSDLEEFQFDPKLDPTSEVSTPLDTDADGLTDSWEETYFFYIGATTGDEDSDGDFDTNAAEEAAGTDPTDPASFVDSDGDQIGDGWEMAVAGNLVDLDGTLEAGSGPGSGTGDFDGDGFSDFEEYSADPFSDPTLAESTPTDTDGDGLADAWEWTYFGGIVAATGEDDSDGDYDSNLAEQAAGTDPTDPSDFVDVDGDGVGDGWEMAYVGNLTDLDGSKAAGSGPGAGTGDWDGDGASDLDEFRYGTDPLSGASIPVPVISVNYAKESSTPQLAISDVAGAVPVSRWNNVMDLDHNVTFMDSGGLATSLAVALSAGVMDSWNTVGTPDENLFSDKAWMGADPQTLTLQGVPYGTYDLYIYLSSWGNEVVEFSLDGGATVAATLTNTFTPNNFAPGDEYVEGDTYVKLSGLSGNVVVTMDATSDELHLAGFQIVQLTPGEASTFADWIAGYPGVGSMTGFEEDADGDGLANGLENFFGTDPSVMSPGLFGCSPASGGLSFHHYENASAATDGMASYEWSTDLTTWWADGASDGETSVDFVSSANDPEVGTTTVSATVSGVVPGKVFVRVKVVQTQ